MPGPPTVPHVPPGGRPASSAHQRSGDWRYWAVIPAVVLTVTLATCPLAETLTVRVEGAEPETQHQAAQHQTTGPGPTIRLTGPRAQEDRWQLIELARANAADPEFETGDRPTAVVVPPRQELHFHSNSGIGGATIEVSPELPSHQEPRSLTLVLHLRGLEQLTLRSGTIELRLAVSHSSPWTARITKLGQNQPESPLDPADRLAPRVECVTEPLGDQPDQARAFRVELPADLLPRPNRPLTVHWIDFFRQ